MPVVPVLGMQRGDEGKGRIVDNMLDDGEYDVVARFNGGDNAGHTVMLPDGRVLKMHLLPSGIARPDVMNVIGNGTLVNPVNLVAEMAILLAQDIDITTQNLKISSGAHLIMPHHISADEIREAGTGRQGSTKSGIAQVSSSKAMRLGARVEMIRHDPDGLRELVVEGLKAQNLLRREVDLEQIDAQAIAEDYVRKATLIGGYATDTVYYLNKRLRDDKPARVLAEGAQAFLLDADHGMYPFTTSTSTTTGGVSTGLGIPPTFISRVVGVAKATQSHVGGGPFVTEISNPDVLTRLYGDMTTIDAERGTTTGRVRRLGDLDLPQLRRSIMVNGITEMALTKLDWIPRYGSSVPICTQYQRHGKTLTVAPDAAYKLEQSTPEYETLPTWQENIQSIRSFNDLPKNARDYVEFIEYQTEVPITMIGVGPGRDQLIIR